LVAWATVLAAQIMPEEADVIVKEHLQSEEIESNRLYVNVNAPSAEGIVVTTSNEESFQAKYACWAYYLKESELSQCRYLFVKEDDGNLLEVIASNDLGQSDLTQWKTLDDVGIKQLTMENGQLTIYPNPTNGQLIIENGQLTMNNVEIYNVVGQKQEIIVNCQLSTVHSIDVSHLPAGIYFLSVYGETKVVYKIIKK